MTKQNLLHSIFVIDDFPPEDMAMLQALYSRDPRSVTEHLKKVKQAGPGKFMEKFYVGYGHKSIGDCGTTTIFIEGLSMLASKAIQDWPLYNGQESSTRYLDFSQMPIYDPINTNESKKILDDLMEIYNKSIIEITKNLKNKYPIKQGESIDIYEKAINARAFDICRGFLPAGMTTMTAWHTNLRQAYDHIKILRNHPLSEIRDLSMSILNSLILKYPNSFIHKIYDQEEEYIKNSIKNTCYIEPFKLKNDFEFKSFIREDVLKRYKKHLKNRPKYCELDNKIRTAGDIMFRFYIDFGSFRDLQRQRSMVCVMPLLTTKLKFNRWYINNFSNEYKVKLINFIDEIKNRIDSLGCDKYQKQYFIPMGFNVAVEMYASIPSTVYISELRSAKTVHATLRPIAQKMGETLKKLIPYIASYCDFGPDEFNLKRGTQDITEK